MLPDSPTHALSPADGSTVTAAQRPVPDWSLRPAGPGDRPVLDRLWLMFRHDLSGPRGVLPRADGTFPDGRLQAALDGDPDRAAHLLTVRTAPAGFALVRGLRTGPHILTAFFVVRGARGYGVGSAVVDALVQRHPGSWQVAFQEENVDAARFWRRAADRLDGSGQVEERRPVPGRPDLPPDVWILFRGGLTAE